MRIAALRGAIPLGQTPAAPVPTLTLFVHMHKGCTRDAHGTIPPDVPCRQEGGETGVPPGLGRSRPGRSDPPRRPGVAAVSRYAYEWGAHLDIAIGLLPLRASEGRGEGWGEGHKYNGRRGQQRLPGVVASSPQPFPPQADRGIESSPGGSVQIRLGGGNPEEFPRNPRAYWVIMAPIAKVRSPQRI